MTPTEKAFVMKAAQTARLAGGKAWKAGRESAQHVLSGPSADAATAAADAAALEAYRAAQAAEDAALSLDPEEALENDWVWETHCYAIGAATAARKAADFALNHA